MPQSSTAFWRGKRVFLTGHSGFKGAWFTAWLTSLGAKVAGLSLAPVTEPSLHRILSHADNDFNDIRDAALVQARMADAAPDIVFHFAAQPLVRAGYRDPLGTYATNVMGTAHVLEAVRATRSVRAVVVITTDKVYENHGHGRPFVEGDRLGGHDPYSNSKAAAELVAQCYRDSYFADEGAARIATARAGNVIGGGDWSEDRLVPDIVRSLLAGRKVELRYPAAVRPWQHVLEPLKGYMMLAERLWVSPGNAPAAVNFGPDPQGFATVAEVVAAMSAALGGAGWEQSPGPHPPEAAVLTLAIDLAREALGWRPRLSMEDTVRWTADWYGAWRSGADMRDVTHRQIAAYEALASEM
ncbi:MAG: CDP-glucose 4,6-dehydratase [Beijerinckiaceae bacterium]